MKRKLKNNLLILLMLTVSLCQNKVYAAENVMVPVRNDEYVSVVLPMIEESDSFNFFIDPLQIFYNTFGNSDKDIAVEEDTHLLFYHRDESEYTLSSRSDCLKIINKSTVPVEVTIKAKLESTEGISVIQNGVFEDRNSCDLYLALVDNEGNKQPLSEKDEVFVTVKLDRAPLDAYAYTLCEDTGEYEYVCQVEDVDFDTYSFGLMGACNEKGDWTSIKGKTHVTLSWNVEPVISDDSEAEEEDEALVEEDKVPIDEDKTLVDEDKVSVGKDEDSGENADVNTESPVSENGVLNDGETVKESVSDIDHSSITKEEESGNDSSAGEFAATENVKDESAAFEEEQTQEFNKPDEKGKDIDCSGDVKEEKPDDDSSTGESAVTKDVKDESAVFEEEQTQESNKLDEKEEDIDSCGDGKEEKSDDDSFTGESAVAEDVKDESAVFEKEQMQELDKPDKEEEDADHSGTAKEEESDNDSSTGESVTAEDVKDESATVENVKNESTAFEKEQMQKLNKLDEKEKDTDYSGTAKEEEPDNGSSTGESAIVKDVKDEFAMFDEKQRYELNKSDEKTGDEDTFAAIVNKNNSPEKER